MKAFAFALMLLGLIPFAPPAAADESWPMPGWRTTTPADAGLDARVLAAFDADISEGKYGYVDSMLVIRHGKIAFERYYGHDYDRIYAREMVTPSLLVVNDPGGPYNYFNPWWHPYYRRGTLHSMQSVTKSVVSAVIGIAVGRGEFPSLDTPVMSFFEKSGAKRLDARRHQANNRVAFAGSGFGGQRPIVLPELDMVLVFTGWNVLPDRPSLSTNDAIARVLAALVAP